MESRACRYGSRSPDRRQTYDRKKVDAAEPGFDGRSENVPRVLHPVYVTDFVAVKRRNRQLGDAQLFEHELDDDLRVEMEIVRIFFERNLRQRRGRIEAIAGMKLRELGAAASGFEMRVRIWLPTHL